ncbi:hypothetical protein Glove_103g170 [Diversispora epigaea]|uniref:Uncharacterized protein n=1 Tax=Diversispora epigaea TaxID=1348612 RepID=A0A397JDX4_9GLOM|nr:hypothetical protein Glove_103g170 [Diversispora epigaea]
MQQLNWASGNEEIDKLIQECQQKAVSPRHVRYNKWNLENQILERLGRRTVILKKSNNSKSCCMPCHGLTKDPSTHDYMFVLRFYDNDSRHFLKFNYHTLTLLKKHKIIEFMGIQQNQISDIYSIDILILGYRPKISENIPLEYATLMKQCLRHF